LLPFSEDPYRRLECIYTDNDKLITIEGDVVHDKLFEIFTDPKGDSKIYNLGSFELNSKNYYIVAIPMEELNDKIQISKLKKNTISDFYTKDDLLYQFCVLKLSWLFLK